MVVTDPAAVDSSWRQRVTKETRARKMAELVPQALSNPINMYAEIVHRADKRFEHSPVLSTSNRVFPQKPWRAAPSARESQNAKPSGSSESVARISDWLSQAKSTHNASVGDPSEQQHSTLSVPRRTGVLYCAETAPQARDDVDELDEDDHAPVTRNVPQPSLSQTDSDGQNPAEGQHGILRHHHHHHHHHHHQRSHRSKPQARQASMYEMFKTKGQCGSITLGNLEPSASPKTSYSLTFAQPQLRNSQSDPTTPRNTKPASVQNS